MLLKLRKHINNTFDLVFKREYNDNISDIENCLNKHSLDIQKTTIEVQERVDNLILNSGGDSHPEVIDSRFSTMLNKTFSSSKQRLDFFDAELSSRNVNVLWFGAKADGETDDSNTIIDAINFCAANEIKELFLPNGLYYVSKPIDTKGVKLVGISPYIPEMTWDYTRPISMIEKFDDYKKQSKGTVLVTDQSIAVFSNGLIAQNIGLFGSLRASGVGIKGNGRSQTHLRDCVIKGFGKNGLEFPEGVIFLDIQKCDISQNKGGIYFDKNIGNYHGETNFLVIENNKISKNEDYGILGNLKGRGTSIRKNDFEGTGEPSDPNRPKPQNQRPFSPQNSDGVKYGCSLSLYNSGSFQNGALSFIDNYSEESYGLLSITGVDPSYGIEISSNVFQPYDIANLSCGFYLDGWLSDVNIASNSISGTNESVIFAPQSNIKNVKIDTKYRGSLRNTAHATVETHHDGNDRTFANITSNTVHIMASLPYANLVDKITYDETAKMSYIWLNIWKVNDYNFGVDGSNNHNVGYALKIGGEFFGIIQYYSIANKIWAIRGDRTLVGIGDGSVEIVRLGGFETINAGGIRTKLVVDWDGAILSNGR